LKEDGYKVISVRNITVTYPWSNQTALKNVSLQLSRGEIGLLLGHNGSGKSTLLHCLSGLIPHMQQAGIEGECRVSQKTGIVLQDSDIFLLPTVAEELEFPLYNQGWPAEKRRCKLQQLASLFQLDPLMNRPVHTLSGGERQRVALAAAMAPDPPILLLDEPLAQMDSDFTAKIISLLKEMASKGTCILIASTSSYLYQALETKCFVMAKGEIYWQGSSQDFQKRWEEAKSLGIDVDGSSFLKNCLWKSPERKEKATPLPVMIMNNIFYSYGQDFSVDNISLSIRAGEIVALTGPNGSGKSTLLKLAAGILQPKKGEVCILGKSIKGLPIAQATAGSGFLFQNPDHQIFQDKVIKEVAWGLKMRKINPSLIPPRVEKWLQRLQIEHLAEEHPYSLTKSDRQWVALAGVLAQEQALLLLDEPTHGMDCISAGRFMEVIAELAAANTAVFMVTHHRELAERCAHRVLYMEKGRFPA
jgi:energy-coupling factor transporter ATP-binding protein EcfA2